MRIGLLSDTHDRHRGLVIPAGLDWLIHCGDFTMNGRIPATMDFLTWFGEQEAPVKLSVPGNHDFCVQENPGMLVEAAWERGIRMLLHEAAVVDGVRVFGSPWQPWFHDWAFNVRNDMDRKRLWSQIPEDTQILLTHSPPAGILDACSDGRRVGCVPMRERVQALPQLALHAFGHIHESAGQEHIQMTSHVQFVNAASLDLSYRFLSGPIVIDLDLGR